MRLERMAAVLFLAAACGAVQADSAAATSATALHDGQHDFDFLIGFVEDSPQLEHAANHVLADDCSIHKGPECYLRAFGGC
jgi:hypothetical protein